MRSIHRAAGTTLFVPLVATLAGATATGLGSDSAGSGVKARVVFCGLVLERAAPCAIAGAPVSVAVGQGDRVVRTLKTRDGRWFRVPLEAGNYWLQPRASTTRGPRVRIAVTKGEWNTVTLVAGRLSPPTPR